MIIKRNRSVKKIKCSNCGKDTFAIERETGLEVKYRDRWMLVLKDTTGTILFRCRACSSTTAHHLGVPTDREG